MDKGLMNVLIIVGMIAGFFLLLKLVYWFGTISARKARKIKIATKDMLMLEENEDGTCKVGTKERLNLEEMKAVIKKHSDKKKIEFAVGDSSLISDTYAEYINGSIIYLPSEKMIKIK